MQTVTGTLCGSCHDTNPAIITEGGDLPSALTGSLSKKKTHSDSFSLNLGDVSSKESSSLREETFLLPMPCVEKGNAFLDPVGKLGPTRRQH